MEMISSILLAWISPSVTESQRKVSDCIRSVAVMAMSVRWSSTLVPKFIGWIAMKWCTNIHVSQMNPDVSSFSSSRSWNAGYFNRLPWNLDHQTFAFLSEWIALTLLNRCYSSIAVRSLHVLWVLRLPPTIQNMHKVSLMGSPKLSVGVNGCLSAICQPYNELATYPGCSIPKSPPPTLKRISCHRQWMDSKWFSQLDKKLLLFSQVASARVWFPSRLCCWWWRSPAVDLWWINGSSNRRPSVKQCFVLKECS